LLREGSPESCAKDRRYQQTSKVVVADNHSSDKTTEVAKQAVARVVRFIKMAMGLFLGGYKGSKRQIYHNGRCRPGRLWLPASHLSGLECLV